MLQQSRHEKNFTSLFLVCYQWSFGQLDFKIQMWEGLWILPILTGIPF
jgi:hypothetical protein